MNGSKFGLQGRSHDCFTATWYSGGISPSVPSKLFRTLVRQNIWRSLRVQINFLQSSSSRGRKVLMQSRRHFVHNHCSKRCAVFPSACALMMYMIHTSTISIVGEVIRRPSTTWTTLTTSGMMPSTTEMLSPSCFLGRRNPDFAPCCTSSVFVHKSCRHR